MKKLFEALVMIAVFLVLSPAAQAANEWGIEHEEARELDGKVVDLACELTGNCPPSCGEGKRQLGLLLDDGTLLPVVKGATLFAGAVDELIAYCGKQVHVDGLLIKDPAMPMYFVQRIRDEQSGEWRKANKWAENWVERNPGKPKGKWFRHDPEILERIEKEGKLGIPGLTYEE